MFYSYLHIGLWIFFVLYRLYYRQLYWPWCCTLYHRYLNHCSSKFRSVWNYRQKLLIIVTSIFINVNSTHLYQLMDLLLTFLMILFINTTDDQYVTITKLFYQYQSFNEVSCWTAEKQQWMKIQRTLWKMGWCSRNSIQTL